MEQLKLNMIPNGVNPVFHASQYDKGRQIRFVLDETLSGAEVTTLYRAKDGTEHGNVQMSVSGNTITDTIPEEVLTDYGIIEGEVNIDGIGSLNFFVEVEKDAYDGGVIVTQTASGAIATFNTNMVEPFKSLKSEINPLQDLHGYSKPWSGGGGKNKLNYEAWKTTGVTRGTAVFENNGVTITATSNDAFTNWNTSEYPVNARVPISEGETITLSWKETTNKIGLISIFPNGTTTGMVTVNNRVVKKATYTATSGITFVTFRFGVANSGDTIAYKNIQIEKGSTATAYEPYSNICPISGFTSANIVKCGVNLFDGVMESGQINTNTGENSPNASRMRTTNYIQLVANRAYYCKSASSCYVYFYDKDKTYLGYVAGSIANLVFTPKNMVNALTGGGSFDNAVYMRMRFDNSTFNVGDLYINYPSTDMAYHAYNGQTATVNFGQTVYGGVADVTNGKVNVTHGIVDLGTLDWVNEDSTLSGLARVNQNQVMPLGAKFLQTPICTHYEGVYTKGYTLFNNGEIGFSNNGQLPFIRARSTEFIGKTNAQIKALMSGVMLCYELATPIEITTTPENLTAIVGQNNVCGDTNGDTTVEYYIEV